MKNIEFKMSTWSQWDLHLHTPDSYDYRNVNLYSDEKLIDTLFGKVRLFSITDHNIINADRIKRLNNIINEKITKNPDDFLCLLPGVELNIDLETMNPSEKNIHLILIFDNEIDYDKLSLAMKNLLNKSTITPDKMKKFKVNEIAESFISFEYIAIIHWGKNNNSPSSNEDRDQTSRYLVSNFFNLAENNPSNNSKNIEALNKNIKEVSSNKIDEQKLIITSDCHDITVYPKHDDSVKFSQQLTYYKAIPSFEGLRMITTDSSRICNNVDEISSLEITSSNENRIKAIKFTINKKEKEVYFSKELNTIIGPRSSGKTLLITSILKSLNDFNDTNVYDEYLMNDDKKIIFKVQRYSDSEFLDSSEIKSLKVMYASQNEWLNKIQNQKNQNANSIIKLNDFKEYFESLNYDNNNIKSYFENELRLEYNFFENIDKLYNKVQEIRFPPTFISRYSDYAKNENNKSNLDFYSNIFKSNAYNKAIDKINLDITIIEDALNGYDNLIKYLLSKNRINIESRLFKELEILKNTIINDKEQNEKMKKGIIKINDKIKNMPNDLKIVKVDKDFHDKYLTVKNQLRDIGKNLFICNSILKHDQLLQSREFIDENGNNEYYDNKEFDIELSKTNVKRYRFEIKVPFIIKFSEENEKDNIASAINNCFYSKSLVKDYKGLVEYIFTKSLPNNKGLYNNNCSLDKIKQLIKQLSNPIETYDIVDLENDIRFSKTSPGRRLSILLELFFCKKNAEIIVFDQPEDHLDSEYIANEMTNYIRNNKINKQLILATHNANIVVNADSENVICCENESNNINYDYGAIELKQGGKRIIRDFIIKNLEGGMQAFEKRENKYGKENKII